MKTNEATYDVFAGLGLGDAAPLPYRCVSADGLVETGAESMCEAEETAKLWNRQDDSRRAHSEAYPFRAEQR